MRLRMTAAAVALAIGAACAGCSSSGGSPTGHPATNGTKPATASTTTAPSVPLGKLPNFTTEDQVEHDMRTVLAMAAQYTRGVPAADKDPQIVVLSNDDNNGGFNCNGVKIAVDVCVPATATSPVTIQINPTVAWTNYQQQNEAGGDLPWQSAVIGAYDTYLTYRHFQRTDMSVLTAQFGGSGSNEAIAKFAHTINCNMGATYTGLGSAMSAQLAATYADPMPIYTDDRAKGAQGLCSQYP